MVDLNLIWFVLLGVLFTGYALLDGFDLGVGVIHLLRRKKSERKQLVQAIGPIWDGNEVWLVTAGGAMFAAFPAVYATVFSAFYLAFVLLLTGLIFRAVSLEFGHVVDGDVWRRVWDLAFGVSSLLIAVLLGVALGNIARGIPLGADGLFKGSFFGLLNPYALTTGFFSLGVLFLHGCLFMLLKCSGGFHDELKIWAKRAWMLVVALSILMTTFSYFAAPILYTKIWALLPALTAVLMLGSIPIFLKRENGGYAFMASCGFISMTGATILVSLFPVLVPSSIDLTFSLTAYNGSSSPYTLGVMAVIALLGMPLVIGYSAFVYWVFRGKNDSIYAD
jgi:cytochrome d ubiquinol oxidase subunit II